MRVAVCFAGQPRTWDLCAGNIKRTFYSEDPNIQVDYFIHTWNENGSDYRGIPYERLNTEVLKEGLVKTFNPRKLVIESYTEKNLEGFDSQRYSISRSIQLKKQYEKEQNFRYDWVFYLRLDFCRWMPVQFSLLQSWLPEALAFQTSTKIPRLYGDVNSLSFREDLKCYSLQDWCYFGLSTDMDVLSYLYSDFWDFCDLWQKKKYREFFDGENFFAFFFLNRGIEIKSGKDVWDLGVPVRRPLEILNLDLSTETGLEEYSQIINTLDWNYSEEDLRRFIAKREKRESVFI